MKTACFYVIALWVSFYAVESHAASSCLDLAPGNSALIDGSMLPDSVAPLLRKLPGYRLKREQDSADGKANYIATVALEFIPGEDTDPSDIDRLEKTVKSCYSTLPPIAGKGASLKLSLAGALDYIPSRKIYLTSNHLRADSQHWSPLSDCRTIIHETLHLLGLVDLYEETRPNPEGGTLYDCRKIGSPSSVMTHIEWANFPRGYDTQYQRFYPNKYYDPGLKSLLYPAEFRMITAPGCTDKNKTYYECASRFHESTANRKAGCTPVSPVCDDPHAWLQ